MLMNDVCRTWRTVWTNDVEHMAGCKHTIGVHCVVSPLVKSVMTHLYAAPAAETLTAKVTESESARMVSTMKL